MNIPAFPGRARLIDVIDAAVANRSARDITDGLRNALCRLMRDSEVILPEAVFAAAEGRYARRQLHQSDEHGYCIVAMTWGPGQGTPIHDHCGMWCVEGVWHGALEVVQYECLGNTDDFYRFQPVGSILAGTGSVGSLIPPHEYHTIRNPSDSVVAVSLHVYSGAMTRCATFEATGQDRCYRRRDRELTLDPMTSREPVHA
jgi:predicted metal-dependent enzyme (double-stranded beta helix superfamily)